MKQIGLAIFCSVVLCFGESVNVFGQVKVITKEQYDTAQKNAHTKVDATLRRVVTEKVKYKADKIDTTETLTIESFPSGDERWNSFTKRDGQTIDTLQLIYLGKYEYRKEGGTDWKKRCAKDCSKAESGGGFGMISGKELPKVEEYLTSETTIAGQAATVYVFYRVYQLGATLNFYDSRIWIGSNGLILSEASTNSDIFPTNRTSLEKVSYEYNPKDVVPIAWPIR